MVSVVELARFATTQQRGSLNTVSDSILQKKPYRLGTEIREIVPPLFSPEPVERSWNRTDSGGERALTRSHAHSPRPQGEGTTSAPARFHGDLMPCGRGHKPAAARACSPETPGGGDGDQRWRVCETQGWKGQGRRLRQKLEMMLNVWEGPGRGSRGCEKGVCSCLTRVTGFGAYKAVLKLFNVHRMLI